MCERHFGGQLHQDDTGVIVPTQKQLEEVLVLGNSLRARSLKNASGVLLIALQATGDCLLTGLVSMEHMQCFSTCLKLRLRLHRSSPAGTSNDSGLECARTWVTAMLM